MGKRWTKADEDYLKEHRGDRSIHTLALALGRTDVAIRGRLDLLQCGGYADNTDLWDVRTTAEYLNINQDMIYDYIERGLIKPIRKTIRQAKHYFFTEDEVERFQREYKPRNRREWTTHEISRAKLYRQELKLTYSEMSKRLNRSISSIQQICAVNGWNVI